MLSDLFCPCLHLSNFVAPNPFCLPATFSTAHCVVHKFFRLWRWHDSPCRLFCLKLTLQILAYRDTVLLWSPQKYALFRVRLGLLVASEAL